MLDSEQGILGKDPPLIDKQPASDQGEAVTAIDGFDIADEACHEPLCP